MMSASRWRDAEVGVGGEPCFGGRKRAFGSCNGDLPIAEDLKDIVASDGCNAETAKAKLLSDFASFRGGCLRVCSAHVADDANMLLGTDGQNGSHAFFEERVVAGVRIE